MHDKKSGPEARFSDCERTSYLLELDADDEEEVVDMEEELLLSGGSWGSLGMGAVAEYRGVAFAIGLGGAIVGANALRMMPQARTLSERTPGRGGQALSPPPG